MILEKYFVTSDGEFIVKRFANTRNIDPKSIIEVSSSLGIES